MKRFRSKFDENEKKNMKVVNLIKKYLDKFEPKNKLNIKRLDKIYSWVTLDYEGSDISQVTIRDIAEIVDASE